MEFNTLLFLMIFMPVFVGMIYILKDNRTRNGLIIFFSLSFYALGSIRNLGLIIATSLLSYVVGRFVKGKRNIYTAYLIVILSALAFFKYSSNFTIFSSIVMPLGISFYIFTSISYVSDCYYGKVMAEENYLRILMFTTFFPTVVSGPLLRYASFSVYLDHKEINTDTIATGLRRFIIGLGKKVIIANQLGNVRTVVFASDTRLSFLLAWYGIIAFAIQLYFDFSSYSDMAIGLAKMIGFTIPENFNYPYMATSIQDFWRRWHISLSSWFRDYVYIPLGGSRVKTSRFIINTLIVWMLTGIWHGSTFNYVLWGLWNGAMLLLYRFLIKDRLDNRFLTWLMTMIVVIIGWTIFNTSSIAHLSLYLRAMAGTGINDMRYIKSLLILKYIPYLLMGIIGSFPFAGALLKKNTFVYDLYLLVVLLLSMMFIISGSYSAFIYFGF